jgi:hypothetical protein
MGIGPIGVKLARIRLRRILDYNVPTLNHRRCTVYSFSFNNPAYEVSRGDGVLRDDGASFCDCAFTWCHQCWVPLLDRGAILARACIRLQHAQRQVLG